MGNLFVVIEYAVEDGGDDDYRYPHFAKEQSEKHGEIEWKALVKGRLTGDAKWFLRDVDIGK